MCGRAVRAVLGATHCVQRRRRRVPRQRFDASHVVQTPGQHSHLLKRAARRTLGKNQRTSFALGLRHARYHNAAGCCSNSVSRLGTLHIPVCDAKIGHTAASCWPAGSRAQRDTANESCIDVDVPTVRRGQNARCLSHKPLAGDEAGDGDTLNGCCLSFFLPSLALVSDSLLLAVAMVVGAGLAFVAMVVLELDVSTGDCDNDDVDLESAGFVDFLAPLSGFRFVVLTASSPVVGPNSGSVVDACVAAAEATAAGDAPNRGSPDGTDWAARVLCLSRSEGGSALVAVAVEIEVEVAVVVFVLAVVGACVSPPRIGAESPNKSLFASSSSPNKFSSALLANDETFGGVVVVCSPRSALISLSNIAVVSSTVTLASVLSANKSSPPPSPNRLSSGLSAVVVVEAAVAVAVQSLSSCLD